MPREPEKRSGAQGKGRRRKKLSSEDEPGLSMFLDDDGDPDGENTEGDSDDDAGGEPEGREGREPDPVPAVSHGATRIPTVADVDAPFVAEGAQNLGQFVERFTQKVETDPENHYFELFRVKPKVDSEGNPCDGYAATFHRVDLLSYEYLQRRVTPGLYTLCAVGINSRGMRRQWLGVLNGLRISKQTYSEEEPVPVAEEMGAKGGGNGQQQPVAALQRAQFVPWGGGQQQSEGQPVMAMSEKKTDVVDMVLLRESMERTDMWAKEAMSQAQRPTIPQAPAAPSSDPQVTTKALELLSDAAKAGPRDQSETERRLLDQINMLRDDLAKLQTRHVDELSKLRSDHMQEVFKERDAATKARDDMVGSYERNLDGERRRSDDLRSNLTSQHQAYIANLEAQNRAHTEAVRASLEARSLGLADQLAGSRDELNRVRTDTANEISRLRQELSESRTAAMTGQHDLVLAKVEAKTAEVKQEMAGDSLSSAGKMLASVKGFAEALGYVPALAQAVAPAEEAGGGTISKLAGAAQSLFASEGFAKLADAAANRLKGAADRLPVANPAVTATSVAAWNNHLAQQRQGALPAAQTQQLPQTATPSAVPPVPAVPPAQQGPVSTQEGIEDAALMGETPESFVTGISQVFSVDVATLRSAVAGASDADVWAFLQVNPSELSVAGREFAASVLVWLRASAPAAISTT